MSRFQSFTSAVRTPLLLIAALVALADSPALVRRLPCLPSALLFVPNTIAWLVYGILLLLLLECAAMMATKRKHQRRDGAVAVVALLLAAAPWVIVRLEGPTVRSLPFCAVGTAVLWCFIVVNAELRLVQEWCAHRPWTTSLMEHTFPIADPFFFTFHRARLGKTGRLRYVPMMVYLALLLALLGGQLQLLRRAIKAEKIPALAYDPYHVAMDRGGLWYAERMGAQAGLWRFDAATGSARPVIRAEDARSFQLEDGGLYLYDQFESRILKMEAVTRRVVWSVPVPRGFGPFDLQFRRGVLIAIGAGGYLVTLDGQGRTQAERTQRGPAWHPQALSDGRIAFISPEHRSLVILKADLTESDQRLLPWAGAMQDARLAAGSGYDEQSQTLYIATWWGEIFRYDLRAQQWLSPYRIAPGVQSIAIDSQHGLLFAYNRARGYVDIRVLRSGQRVQVVLVNVYGNAINLNPEDRVAIVSSRGPVSLSVPQPGGLYQCSYQAVTPSRWMQP